MIFLMKVSFMFIVLTLDCIYALECPQDKMTLNRNCTKSYSRDISATERMMSSPSMSTSKSIDKDQEVRNGEKPLGNTIMKNFSIEKITKTNSSQVPKGRSLNFTTNMYNNRVSLGNISPNSKTIEDLSDVSISDEEEMADIIPHKIISSTVKIETNATCSNGDKIYQEGEKMRIDCDLVCICKNGKMDCMDRCLKPFFRRGKTIQDPSCEEHPSDDPCCAVLYCIDSESVEPEPLELCRYKNTTYSKGETFHKGCEEECICDTGGKATCKPRCLPKNTTENLQCVEVPDPENPCCKKLLCDVTLHDNESEDGHKLISAKYVNSSMIKIKFEPKLGENESSPIVELSDNKNDWVSYKLLPDGYLPVQNSSKYIRLEGSSEILSLNNKDNKYSNFDEEKQTCTYKGKFFKLNEEFNDNCAHLCICKKTGMTCLKLDCPTYFGTDVLDATCIEWETVPPHFIPSPPICCPTELRCKNNGSCFYKDEIYQNWQHLPSNVTGCEKRCYCEMGKIECQNVCPPLRALPGPDLPCPLQMATVDHVPDDDCCMQWICKPEAEKELPAGLQNRDQIIVRTLEAIDAHTVRLAFIISPVIVGLHGRVEVRYTDNSDSNTDNWQLQVFAPPNDLIATPQLEFDLLGLKSDTEYAIKITITLRDLHNTPTSPIYKIKTHSEVSSTLPPLISIQPELNIAEVNSSWVTASWRQFSEYELQFIDGIQLRYKEIDGRIYAATPLIHRAVSSFTIENLKPNTKYEVGIYFIPFPGQPSELHADHMAYFTTANELDSYAFNVTLEIGHIKSTSTEISWFGVPYPEDKYVNIYRAIYQSDSGKDDQNTFKMAKRDSPTKAIITDLKPGTRYRLWLEVYLTNGKIKTSNVQDFITKPRIATALGSASLDELSNIEQLNQKGEYYAPLVVVAILAIIAIMTTLVLLLVILRRHKQNKAAITPPTRISQSAYDNPTYKIEIQQETMGL